MTDADFDKLPRFDARDFEPPAWATSDTFAWGTRKTGESSKSSFAKPNGNASTASGGEHDTQEDQDGEDGDGEDVWEDASEGRSEIDIRETILSIADLREAVQIAKILKTQGNSHFTSKPHDHAKAILSYQAALDVLPPCPKKENEKGKGKAPPPKVEGGSGIEEVTEEEAALIEQEAKSKEEEVEPELTEREEAEEEIRECAKACHGNLAACYLAEHKDKEAADACTEALKLDPQYVKALQRRATANERISSWSSLTTAQEDYNLLVKLLPPNSAVRTAARRALLTLPDRIRIQQEKEKDEMLGKLKELGNGLLGKFGLSTDMFKFDQQDGGGYNMRFER